MIMQVVILSPHLYSHPFPFHLIVYTHYVSISCSHFLCPSLSFSSAIHPNIRSTLCIRPKSPSPYSPHFLNLGHSLHIPPPFLLTYRSIFYYASIPPSSSAWPLNTLLPPFSLSVFLTRPLITLIPYQLPLHVFLPLHPFIHACYHSIPLPSVKLKSSILEQQTL